jgi:drug/metabolite transporter (DMT)-like permease
METVIDNIKTPNNGKATAGVIILIVGALLLIDNLNVFFIPGWLFSWPMWIIAYGVYMGGKYNFKKPIWAIMIALGVAFLLSENIDNADNVVWPVLIIGSGLWMVFRNSHKGIHADYHQKTEDQFHKI